MENMQSVVVKIIISFVCLYLIYLVSYATAIDSSSPFYPIHQFLNSMVVVLFSIEGIIGLLVLVGLLIIAITFLLKQSGTNAKGGSI